MNSIQLNQKFSKTQVLEMTIWLVYIFCSLCLTSGGPIWYVVPVMALFAYLLVSSMLHEDFCNSMVRDPKVICLIIYVVVLAIEGLPLGGMSYIGKQIVFNFHMYMPIMLFLFFSAPKRRNMLKKVVQISYLFILFFCVYNVVFYTLFPAAARRARDHEALIGGGYGLACGLAILIPFLLSLLLNGYFKKRKMTSLGVVIALILMAFTVIKTESTITVIACAVGILLTFYFHHKSKKTLYIKILIIPLIVLVVMFVLPYFGEFLRNFAEGKMQESRLYMRLYYLGTFLSYGDNNTYAEYFINRLSLPFNTFETFLKNPLFGVAYKFGSGFLNSRDFGVENHGEWFDALASFGIVGGVPFVAMYIFQIKETLAELKRKRISVSKIWVVVLVILALFNPLNYFHFNFFFFFFVPSVALLLKDTRKKEVL